MYVTSSFSHPTLQQCHLVSFWREEDLTRSKPLSSMDSETTEEGGEGMMREKKNYE